jgi:hypothetical protein
MKTGSVGIRIRITVKKRVSYEVGRHKGCLEVKLGAIKLKYSGTHGTLEPRGIGNGTWYPTYIEGHSTGTQWFLVGQAALMF